jgi:hypothetical protein
MENGGPAVLAPSPHAVSTRRKVPGGRGAASALDRQRGVGLHDAGHLPRQSTELMSSADSVRRVVRSNDRRGS